MGQVSTKFTGDPKQLLSAYQQLYAANVKLQEQNANTARQSSRDRNVVVDHIKGEIRGVMALGASYLTVSTAVGTVTKAYDEWRSRLSDIAAKAKEGNLELTRQINLAGHAANASYVIEQLKNIPGATRADGLAAYRGVTTGTDYKVSPSLQLALVRAAAPQAALGLSEADLESLGEFAGQLATLDPNASPQRSVEKGLQIQAAAGRHFEKLRGAKVGQAVRQLVAHNIPEDYVWGLAIEAASQDAPQLIAQLAAASTSPFEKPDTKGRTRLTPEEAAKTRFAAASFGEERLAMLLSDPAVAQAVLPDQSDLIARLNQDAAAELGLSILKGAGTSADRRRQLTGNAAGAQTMNNQQVAVEASLREKQWIAEARDRELLDHYFQQWRAENRPGWFESMVAESQWGMIPHSLATQPKWAPGIAEPFIEARNRETQAGEGYTRFTPEGRLTPEALERQAKLLEETNRLLREIRNKQSTPGPAPVTNLNER